MDDCIDSLGDAVVFTTLHCNSGYWKVPVAPEDQDKTTFTTHRGTFRYTRMPFGLKNAHATFQLAQDIILSGAPGQICLVYLDYVIFFSKDLEQHLAQVDTVLRLLRNAGVSLKLKKGHFFQPRVDYLGHVVLPGKLTVATDTAAAFKEFVFPQTLTQQRSFLGACNVYRRFVKDFSKISRRLTGMLKEEASPNFENPTEEQLTAFETLKDRLTSPPVLALPKAGRNYRLDTDASDYQLGCTLLQAQEDDVWHPVGYWSKLLNEKERRYSPTNRECYAIVWAMRTLRPYLEGVRFKVRTGHAALRWILTITESTGRLTWWRLLLSEFDYEIDYIPGRVNSVPDALSRVLIPAGDPQPVEADVPVSESNDHCDADCDHAKVLVTTRNQASAVAPKQKSGPKAPAGPPIPGVDSDGVAPPPSDETPGEPGPADDVDFDIFDFDIQREGYDIPDARDLPAPPTNAEILEEQRGDAFCLQVLAEQDSRHRHFHAGPGGILRRRHPIQPDLVQIVLPKVLRPRVLRLCHYWLLAGHPGLNRI